MTIPCSVLRRLALRTCTRMRELAQLLCFLSLLMLPLAAFASPLRIAIYADGGAMEPYISKAADAATSAGMTVARVTAADIAAGALDAQDAIVFPGGTGSGQAKSLGVDASAAVRAFAESGGGVIGVCAGGYLLTQGYSDDTRRLELINAHLWDLEHWARGAGTVQIQPVGTSDSIPIQFENAPVFAPATRDLGLPPYGTLATFTSDLVAEPTGRESIVGRDAIIAAPFGKGRVVLFGPHPELTPGLEPLLQSALRWVAGEGDGALTWANVLGRAAGE